MQRLVAGVDTSTQSTKVVICDGDTGAVVRTGRANHPEGTEVAPQYWWEAFLTAVDEAGGLADVSALAVGGQQHGMVCLDADGEVIRPALLWNDTRSAGAAEDLIAELGDGSEEDGKKRWAELTGSVPVASITATKLRWLADNEPENAARIAAVCLPHDWLTWKIRGTGKLTDLVTDRSDASGTGYLDLRTSRYRRELLAHSLRISADQAAKIVLPRVCEPWENTGHGDPDRGWGEMALGPGCGDNAGAALGLGLQPGQALLSLGTSGVVAAVAADPVTDPTGMVTGFQDATGAWLPLACTLNGARVLDAGARLLKVDHDEFSRLALQAAPGAGGLVLVPYFEGERTPNLPNATGTLSGVTTDNLTSENLARAFVEGICCLLADALDAVRALGAPIAGVLLVGGGAQSAAIREIAPSILGAEVRIPSPGEFVARGAARQAAALATGQAPDWPLEVVALHETTQPRAPILDDYRLARANYR